LPEPDTRLEAFRRGADDFLGKPFSPRELVARIRRLLVRAGDTRAARARARELERALAVSREEAVRAAGEARRAGRLRELAELLDERRDARAYDREQLATLATIAEVSGGALAAAARVRALSLRMLALLAPDVTPAASEAARHVERAARALALPEGTIALLVHG